MLPTVRFSTVVPSGGFHWVYKNDEGVIELRDPPADWPAVDYESTSFDLDDDEEPPESVLCDRFFLATSITEYRKAAGPGKLILGHIIEPRRDLYLSFASQRPSPASIKAMADQYGLLNMDDAWDCFDGYKGAHDLHSGFEWEWGWGFKWASPRSEGPLGEETPELLGAESARQWLGTHSRICSNIKLWNGIKNKQEPSETASFLAYCNENTNLDLSIYLHHNGRTNEVGAEFIVRSLETLIEVQFRMSLASSVTHRQCDECTGWMAIHPGSGRPDKQYCSDACRMRAYRKRKAASQAT